MSTNSKKAVVTAIKGEHQTVESLGVGTTSEQVSTYLQHEYQCILNKRYITKRKNAFYFSSKLSQFHKTKKSRKLTKIYYLIDEDKTFTQMGKKLVLSNTIAPSRKSKKNPSISVSSPRR